MALRLKPLDQETWGEKLRRARDHAGWKLSGVAYALGRLDVKTSQSTLQRLEHLDEVPTDLGRRSLAVLALLIYGIDPEEFDLALGDLPERLRPDRRFGAWGELYDSTRPTSAALEHLADMLDPPRPDSEAKGA